MESVTLTIRISPDMKETLEKIASADSRSLNNLINIILKKYISEHTSGGE